VQGEPLAVLIDANLDCPHSQWPVKGYFDDIGWGFGMSVRTRRTHLGPSVGSYGWNGGYGIVWYNDPAEDMTTILMNQGGAGRPTSPIFLDFLTATYQAIDD
jgi:CubicO group peptidase (beta-lactamase class C family)